MPERKREANWKALVRRQKPSPNWFFPLSLPFWLISSSNIELASSPMRHQQQHITPTTSIEFTLVWTTTRRVRIRVSVQVSIQCLLDYFRSNQPTKLNTISFQVSQIRTLSVSYLSCLSVSVCLSLSMCVCVCVNSLIDSI